MNTLALQSHSNLRTTALTVLLLTLLAGCATSTSVPGSGGPPPGSPEAAPGGPLPGSRTPSPLVSEQRWLEEWFRGTPVVIALADVNTLTVDVPLANSFDVGKSSPKPALAKVLDHVATSLRRQPAMRVSIAAPSDAAAANATLATARAQQLRDNLVARGVPATRMSGVGTARAGAAVQLRLLATPQAIGRLDDASLPAPSAGVKPVVAAPAAATKR